MRSNKGMIAGLVAVLLSSPALADCIAGMRDATPGEIQYFKRVSAALREALPPAPRNWTLAPPREPDLGALCADAREGAFDVRVSGIYGFRPTKEESDRLDAERRKLQMETDALSKLPPAVAQERQVWLDKMSEANRASNAAAKAGDKALAKRKDAEAEEYSAKGHAVRDRYMASVRPQLDRIEARRKELQLSGISEVKVTLVANESEAHRLGADESRAAAVGRMPTPKAPGLKVHNVQVYLEGQAARREAIQAAIEKEKLARIVER